MGIIGVVAALTLPNLNSSTGEKEKVAKLKKIYSNLEDAYGRATAVYGPIDEWFKNDTTTEQKSKRFGERMTEFMKLTKNCGMSSKKDECYRQVYPSYSFVVADGCSIEFNPYDSSTSPYAFEVYVDIDGSHKGKNSEGIDRFKFSIKHPDTNSDIAPAGIVIYDEDTPCDDLYYCTAWVIKNENLDYLKCSDLNWETKTSCK